MPALVFPVRVVVRRVFEAVAFPWQAAVLVVCLSVGAAVRMHPEVLRPIVHQAQMAAVENGR